MKYIAGKLINNDPIISIYPICLPTVQSVRLLVPTARRLLMPDFYQHTSCATRGKTLWISATRHSKTALTDLWKVFLVQKRPHSTHPVICRTVPCQHFFCRLGCIKSMYRCDRTQTNGLSQRCVHVEPWGTNFSSTPIHEHRETKKTDVWRTVTEELVVGAYVTN